MHQRVADFFDQRFVQLGFAATNHQANILAQLMADVAHHTVEAVEGFADLHHAQLQGAVADVLHQPRQQRGGFHQLGGATLARQFGGAGAGNHQLAHQINQPVEFFRLHAQHARFAAGGTRLGWGRMVLAVSDYGRRAGHRFDLGADFFVFDHPGGRRSLLLGLLNGALPLDGGLDHFRANAFVLDQNGANRRAIVGVGLGQLLAIQANQQFGFSQCASAQQHFTQQRTLIVRQGVDQGNVVFRAAVRRQDVQLALVTDKIKHCLDFRLAGAGFQANFKTQVAGFRIHLCRRRHGVGQGLQLANLTQGGQKAQKGDGVHTMAQDVFTKAHRDMPDIGGGFVAWCGRGRFGGGGGDAGAWGRAFQFQSFTQAAIRVDHTGGQGGFALFQRIQQQADVISAVQQQADAHFRRRQAAIAQLVEQVFHLVGEAFQVAAFHHASAALDGVGSAEDGVDVAGFFRVGFQCQQAGFHFRQLFAAFLYKNASQFIHEIQAASTSGSVARGVAKFSVSRQNASRSATAGLTATIFSCRPLACASRRSSHSNCRPAVSISPTRDKSSVTSPSLWCRPSSQRCLIAWAW